MHLHAAEIKGERCDSLYGCDGMTVLQRPTRYSTSTTKFVFTEILFFFFLDFM